MSESFWDDLYGRTRLAWKKLWEAESIRERERYCGVGWQERSSDSERDNRNGFYERDDVTRFGPIRLRELEEGSIRPLTEHEVRLLYHHDGLGLEGGDA